MLDKVFGLPTHALVVHTVVVLLPLAALSGVVVALWPAARRRYGLLVGALTIVAVLAVQVATRSGRRLRVRLNAKFGPADATEAGLMERHAALGDKVLPWAIMLLVGVLLVVGLPLLAARIGNRASAAIRAGVLVAVAVTLVGAVLTTTAVVRAGHAGSKAVWEKLDRPAAPPGGG
jgi:hypothetical protein